METRKRSKRLLRMIERIKRMKISLIHEGNHYPTLTVFALFYLQVFRLQEVQVPPVSFETQLIESTCEQSAKPAISYRKIPKISPGAYTFQRPFLEGLFFWRGLYSEGLIYGGKFAFQNDWAGLIVGRKFTVLLCVTLYTYLRAISKCKPPEGLYLEGRFNAGFFALRVWGAYIWRGLYMEGLIFEIVR